MVDLNTIESVTGAAQTEPQQPTAPTILMGSQYIRNVSFQVADQPLMHTRPPVRPQTRLNLDVNARQLGENLPDFEVELAMRCVGHSETPEDGSMPTQLFEATISYAGLFSLRNTSAETFEPLLLVEAPRMLFPGARNFLADITREAGFLPVIIQQIDFVALWRSRRASAKPIG